MYFAAFIWRDMKEVDLDVDCFLNDIESVMKRYGPKDGATAVDSEEGSSSDMDFGMFIF